MMKKKKITPHKGGRTEIISPIRVTKEEKKIIDKARNGQSYSDFLVQFSKKIISKNSK